MLSLFAKKTQLQTIIKTLFVRRSGNIGCATSSISSTTNCVQLSSRRFIFNSYAIQNYNYQRRNFVKSNNNHDRSILKHNTSRPLSTLDDSALMGANIPVLIDNEKRELHAVFPDIVRELSEITAQIEPKYTPEWFAKSLQYNTTRGKLYRSVTTVLAFKTLAKPEMITPENIRLAQYLGWCTEMGIGALLILDDILDGSEIRRGWPCWYKLDNVKLSAINDALMMENGLYMLLKKHFSNTSYYADIYEIFHEAVFVSCCGQVIDLQHVGLDELTMERYSIMAQCKASECCFYLPISLGMHLAGYTDPNMFRQVKEITVQLGEFYQIQNDIIDCFGNPNLTGKVGNDIENGATTWLSTLCMQRATEEQKHIMRENYGKNDPEKVASIKKLYEDLDLRTTYLNYEKELYNTIETELQTSNTPDGLIKLIRLVFNIYIKQNKW